ncbi:MAG: PEP-CTERM sorting domain-containing protein [Phycisphaerales bacterium]|nr:PEP-CTERM sorting domain-containing protein [Phycisphaerales bacterium]
MIRTTWRINERAGGLTVRLWVEEKKKMRIAGALIVLAGVVVSEVQAGAGILTQTYDAGLGTFPVDQGFTQTDTPDPGPPLVVQGGLLHQDTRGYRQSNFGAGYQFFSGQHAPADFTNGLQISMEMQVVESSYDPDFSGFGGTDSRSAGYGIIAVDDLGRIAVVGITDTGVFLNNEIEILDAEGSAFIPFDSTDSLHTYDVSISALGISLEIDGNPTASLQLGSTGQFPPNFGTIGFGDLFDDRFSAPTESVTDLAEFSYTILPEPAGILMMGFVGAVTMGRRRRS